MIPKMKKTKKQRTKTFPNMGSVSRSSMTRILMDGMRLMARSGLKTRTVLMADKLMLSIFSRYSTELQDRREKWASYELGNEWATREQIPSQDDEGIQSIPIFGQVCTFAPTDSHRNHFDQHFKREEDVNEVIEQFQKSASWSRALDVTTRMVHPQSYAVHDDRHHRDPLKPRVSL